MELIKNLLILITAWTIIIFLSLFWNIHQLKYDNEKIICQSARSFFNLIVLTRKWNALHGGVYAPITEITKPNPYLKKVNVKLRDIYINNKLTLTLINPAYMTRQLSELAEKEKEIKFRITSLKPLNPKNSPKILEKKAILEFEKGKNEFMLRIDDKFFYMAPLKVEKPCLKCHNSQGYKIGDIIGGISVTIPYINIIPYNSLIFGYFVIWVIGIIVIKFYNKRLNDAYEKIKKQAIYDGLTGMLNRREFKKRLEKEFNRAKRNNHPISLIMCDIDHFKNYNDTYGHQMGDEVLKKVAKSILNSIKRPGDFCARYGGEEFAVVLPETEINGALHIAKKIKERINNLNITHKNSQVGKLTISMGVASENNFSINTYEDLIMKADRALYKAKENGRNKIENL